MKQLFAALLLVSFANTAKADETEFAAVSQRGSEVDTQAASVAYSALMPKWGSDDWTSRLDLFGRLDAVERKSADSYTVQVWEGRDRILQKSYGVAPTLEWQKTWGLGIGYFGRSSEISSGHSYGLNPFGWFLQETLKVGLGFRSNQDDMHSAEYIDVDATRIITPTEVAGKVYSVDAMFLASETTIFEGGIGLIDKSDRPQAKFANIKLRQYFKAVDGAVHASYTHFDNTGELKPITSIGEVLANTAELQWHQRFASVTAATGYRYNIEHHTRRAEPRTENQIGSDYVWMRVGWRFWRDVWTDPATEIYVTAADYRNSEDVTARTFGMGMRVPH